MNAVRIVLLACSLLWLAGCVHAPSRGENIPVRFLTLSFPRVPLNDKEAIQLVEVEVINGQVSAINQIPDGWSLELNENCSTCQLSARHFSAGIRAPQELDGLITIAAGHPSRFDIRTRLVVESSGSNAPPARELSLFPVDLDFRVGPPAKFPTVVCDTSRLPSEWFTEYRPPLRLADARGEYIVHLGDTAAAIAQDFHLAFDELKAINPGVDLLRLRVGQKIKVVKDAKD
jgi:hypothetical protein